MLRILLRICRYILFKFETDGAHEDNQENLSDVEKEIEREFQSESKSEKQCGKDCEESNSSHF